VRMRMSLIRSSSVEMGFTFIGMVDNSCRAPPLKSR
jgi:hypothetical protein